MRRARSTHSVSARRGTRADAPDDAGAVRRGHAPRCAGPTRDAPALDEADRCDRGSVTAELAVALPAVLLVLVLVVMVAGAGLTQARCVDAARVGARVAALGEPAQAAAAAARRVAGPAARVTVSGDAQWVTVAVDAAVPLAGWDVGPLRARGSAVAWVEP